MKTTAMICAMALMLSACANQNGLRYQGGAQPGQALGAQNASGISSSSLGGAQGFSQATLQERIGDTILFPVDQATLTPQALSILDAQASWLQNYQGAVQIEGHADEQGTREYNLALGARRAAAVRDYLVSRGVTRARISVVTYGKERPLAVCSDESCWSKNRRAVTLVK